MIALSREQVDEISLVLIRLHAIVNKPRGRASKEFYREIAFELGNEPGKW